MAAEAKLCGRCKKPVDLRDLRDDDAFEGRGGYLAQADALGMESCEEDVQAVLLGHLCIDCYNGRDNDDEQPD